MLARASHRSSFAFAALLTLWSAAARAEDDAATRQAARKLAEDGVLALQNGDALTASQKLEKAHQMLRVPSVALWSARALVKKGQWVEAAERLREVSRLASSGDAAVQEEARRDAEKELAELTPRIPILVVGIVGAEPSTVTVTLDGAAVPGALLGEDRPVNPGTHQLVGTRGDDRVTTTLSVAEGERKQAELRFTTGAKPSHLAPAPPPALPPAASSPGAQRTLAYVALGTGAAGLVVGGIAGGLALSKKAKLDDDPACADDRCTYQAESDVSSLRTFRTVSTLGFVAGGVLAATGVVLWVTAPSAGGHGSRQRPTLALGLGHVRLAGSF